MNYFMKHCCTNRFHLVCNPEPLGSVGPYETQITAFDIIKSWWLLILFVAKRSIAKVRPGPRLVVVLCIGTVILCIGIRSLIAEVVVGIAVEEIEWSYFKVGKDISTHRQVFEKIWILILV